MILSAVLTPVYVAFIEEDDSFWSNLNTLFDVGFGCDMFIHFISAYYDKSHNLVTDFRLIAFNYLRSWFWVDLAAM